MVVRRIAVVGWCGLFAACAASERGTGPFRNGAGGGGGGTNESGGGLGTIEPPDDCTATCDGVCIDGECCTEANACGDTCCDAGAWCLFGGCVTPGDSCYSSDDCLSEHYCEPALGDGVSELLGPHCEPLPPKGKCLPSPDVCGEGEDGEDCLEPCEYHPPAGALTAVAKWQWGYEPAANEWPEFADVWSTPAVARIHDANCDGQVDGLDPPNIALVAGNAKGGTCSGDCASGILRLLNGKTGEEVWTVEKAQASSKGFAGVSVAVGDLDGDERLDIVALTGEGRIAIIADDGTVKHVSNEQVGDYAEPNFGWGGAIALGDMDGDGWPEIAYARNLFTTKGGQLSAVFTDGNGNRLSHFVDLDGDGDLELLAGKAYHHDGEVLWTGLGGGSTATGDFDGDGKPEIVVVHAGSVAIYDGEEPSVPELGPMELPGGGWGGPPTVADFDGDGEPEIGVADLAQYSMLKPNYADGTIDVLWSKENHDFSSSQTGSSVFDFEGDGQAEVVYMDECFLWVYDGKTGEVLFATPSQSFTATENPIVADADGDGRAEIVMIHNGADASQWGCDEEPWNQPDPQNNRPAWKPPNNAASYRGVTLLGGVANAWVGTRTLWNQHAYSVSNVCDPSDDACAPGSYYGQIPTSQKKNWQQSWLNNFRQNVQHNGLFDAPDVTVGLSAVCVEPVPLELTVASVSADHTGRIWNVNNGSYVELLGHRSEVNYIDIAGDGRLGATCSDDGTVRTWDTTTGRPFWRAPLLLAPAESTPVLLSHRGWTALGKSTRGKRTPALGARLRDALAGGVRYASYDKQRRSRMCLHTYDGKIELWDLQKDAVLQSHVAAKRAQLVATPHGCLFTSEGRAQLVGESGTTSLAGERAAAIAFGEGVALVATDSAVLGFEQLATADGQTVETWSHPVQIGVTAVAMIGERIAVGYRDGNMEFASGASESAPRFESVPASAVLRLLEGPQGTLVAGFANGEVGLWDPVDGQHLFHSRLHGPIVHFVLDKHRLYIATDLGAHTVWDLGAFYGEYCHLMRDVWKRIPIVWSQGRAEMRAPDAEHPCHRRD